MKRTQTPARRTEVIYTFEEVAEYHHVPVGRIKALAEAGHFGVIGYIPHGRGHRREYLIPESAMRRPLPKAR